MSTRSYIGIRNTDGSVTSIYCHFDGYPSSVGKKLFEHYADETKIRALLDLGDLSCLGREIGEKHPFGSGDYKEMCTAYHRDSEEPREDTQPVTFKTVEEFLKQRKEDWTYLFDNGEWLCRSYDNMPLEKLAVMIEKDK
jgi:hypothetical protein